MSNTGPEIPSERCASLKDVAEKAGVSIGTVDRVLHKRGRFAHSTRDKVLAAAKALNYSPNLSARRLKQTGPCRIAVMQALASQDQGFWREAATGVNQARREFGAFNVVIDVVEYDRHDDSSFAQACQQVIAGGYQGLLLAPLLADAAVAFVAAHPELMVATFDCPLIGSTVSQSFFQDSYVSGATAADLMTLATSASDKTAVIAYEAQHPYIQRRVDGFKDTLHKNGHSTPDIFTISDEMDQIELRDYLKQSDINLSQYAGLFVAKTGVHKYATILNESSHNCFLIGHDCVQENIDALNAGTVDILISQSSARQAFEGLKSLVDTILYNRQPGDAQRTMPIDILTRSNVDAYLNYMRA